MTAWTRYDADDGAGGHRPEETAAPPRVETPAPTEPPTDEALLARIAEHRDKTSFAALFDRYARRVKAFMIRAGATHEAADEAAQEAMIAVWRRAETFNPEKASAAAWIFAIARNKRIDLIRRASRPEPDPEDPLYKPDDVVSAEKTMSDDARDVRVRAALSALSDDQRLVVHLSFYEGRAHSEIAEQLDIPLGTVKSRLRLAFGKLRDALGLDFKDELVD